jgi:hypothetical protein
MSIPISSNDFRRTTGMFPTLQPLATSGGAITAIAVTIGGIAGRNAADRAPVSYRILASVRDLQTALPVVWIASPDDAAIRHVNIFRAAQVCPFTGTRLPTLCWGRAPQAWVSAGPSGRGLANLLEAARQVLADANPQSAAR